MHYVVGDEKNLTKLSVKKGDVVEINLDETPTSGYSWEVESISNDMCLLQSTDYRQYENAGIGGGGIRKITFLITANGNGYIKLKNCQRWSGDVYKRFEITIESQ